MDWRISAVTKILLFAVAGTVFGAMTSMCNVFRIPILPQLLGDGWSWAAIGIAVAVIASVRRTLTVMVVLVAAVAGYYASDVALGVYNSIDFSDPRAMSDPATAPLVTLWVYALIDFVKWSVCAVLVSWPLARVGVATRRGDGWGLAARMAVPLGAAVEVLALRLPAELAVQPNVVTVATYGSVACIGIAAATALCLMRSRNRSRGSNQPTAAD